MLSAPRPIDYEHFLACHVVFIHSIRLLSVLSDYWEGEERPLGRGRDFAAIRTAPEYCHPEGCKCGTKDNMINGQAWTSSVFASSFLASLFFACQVFDDGQSVFLVQDLLRGEELLDRLLRMPNFTERDASDIICTLTKTVEYLHSQGVRRRDRTTRNVKLWGIVHSILQIYFQLRLCDK